MPLHYVNDLFLYELICRLSIFNMLHNFSYNIHYFSCISSYLAVIRMVYETVRWLNERNICYNKLINYKKYTTSSNVVSKYWLKYIWRRQDQYTFLEFGVFWLNVDGLHDGLHLSVYVVKHRKRQSVYYTYSSSDALSINTLPSSILWDLKQNKQGRKKTNICKFTAVNGKTNTSKKKFTSSAPHLDEVFFVVFPLTVCWIWVRGWVDSVRALSRISLSWSWTCSMIFTFILYRRTHAAKHCHFLNF